MKTEEILMKKHYETPLIQTERIEELDVITASPVDDIIIDAGDVQ